VDERKSSLLSSIEGVRNFNSRLRTQTYNRDNIVEILLNLLKQHSCVIVSTEESTVHYLKAFLMRNNVPLLYYNQKAYQLEILPEHNIYLMTSKRQLMEMISSIPRFFSASSSSKTNVKSVLEYQQIHLYFESSVTEGYKREIIELAEQEHRRIIPHEIQNHHEIQCLADNVKDEMFVCIVKSSEMYERLMEKPMSNLLVYCT
jgi:hypothetical protein